MKVNGRHLTRRWLTTLLLLVNGLITASGLLAQPALQLDFVAGGFVKPVAVSTAGDGRLFIAEQAGRVRIVDVSGTPLGVPFLDITGSVLSSGSEQGLLGMAFAPDYDISGRFYVNYTTGSGSGRTRISRFLRDAANPDLADPSTEEVLLEFDQPYTNHNGGDLHFGPDGHLYISSGDGGSAGDPLNNAQNPGSLLGKILRIDVSPATGYAIPVDNPYSEQQGKAGEIWSLGFRNPWRFSFDRTTGDMWLGDVGQNATEEIDHEPAASPGNNYGWRCYEGSQEYNDSGCGNGFGFPVFEYPHNSSTGGFAVTGGYVYRGEAMPYIRGTYFFADYVSGNFWTISVNDTTGDFETALHQDVMSFVSAFGEDYQGELYAVQLSSGNLYKVMAGCPEILLTVGISQQGDSLVADRLYGRFQWFLNGDTIIGASDSYIHPSEEGTYHVSVIINQGGCHYEAVSNTIVHGLSTGMVEEEGLPLFVFPNPVRQRLNVHIPGSGKGALRLYDSLGKVVYARKTSVPGILVVEMAGMMPGLYILEWTGAQKGRASSTCLLLE